MEKVLHDILKNKIIAIIRTKETDYSNIKKTAESLRDGGVNIIEVTLNTPSSLHYIKQLKEDFPEMLIGAGTVVDCEDANLALNANADFLLAPALDVEVIKLAHKNNTLIIPGVLSPTEIVTASKYGVKLLKIFPASSVGPKYIKDLLGPFNQLNFMPVGGVNVKNTKEFLEAGSEVIGLGSSLVNNDLIRHKRFDEIKRISNEFRTIVNEHIRVGD